MSNRTPAILLIGLVVVSVGGYIFWRFILVKPLTVRIGYIPLAVCVPYWVAAEKGFYRDEGLNVTLIRFPATGSGLTEALAAGSLDIGYVAFATAAMAFDKGIDIRMATDGGHTDQDHEGAFIVVGKDSGILSVKDLKGKNLGLPGWGGLPEAVERYLLRKHNLTMADVNVVLIPGERALESLIASRIDAAYLGEPYLTYAMNTGNFTKLCPTVGSFFADHRFQGGVAIFLREFLNQHKDTVDAFIRAQQKAIQWMDSHPDDTRAIIANYTGLDIQIVKNMQLYAYSLQPDLELINRCLNLLKEEGLISRTIRADEIMYIP